MPAPTPRLDLASIGALSFEAPDETRFPALRLAHDVLASGGSAGTVLNAANEIAVEAFLGGRIRFLEIGRLVEATLDRSAHLVAFSPDNVDEVLAIDAEARAIALSLLRTFAQPAPVR
jgi:1-deoxy-D-xylulose-5-phosphate reductoisomerase